MHKTGSTSIQDTLADSLEGTKFWYMNLGDRTYKSRNHGQELSIAFLSDPLKTKAARLKIFNKNRILKIRERIPKIISHQIDRGVEVENFIFSAEGLCHFNEKDLRNFKDFLSSKDLEYLVVGYIRTPKSFMESAFQQKLKKGAPNLDLKGSYPEYKRKLEKFGTVFGWDNVRWWLFDPKSFPEGCVVQDFCSRLNIPIQKENIVRTNESLSKEAISLLYAYRLHGLGYGLSELLKKGGGRRALQETRKLETSLYNLKGSKFRLSSSFVKSIFLLYQADIEWMQEKLGRPLAEDLEKDDTTAINREEDLLEFAPEATYWLAEQLGDDYVNSWNNRMTPEQVAEWMHLLRHKLSHRVYNKISS